MDLSIVLRRAGLIGCLGAPLTLACSGASPGPSEDPAAVNQPISGDGTSVVTFSQNMPERAVGFITDSVGLLCSATPILRDVVLTAGHCFCKFPSVFPSTFSFHLFNAAGVDVGPTASGIVARDYKFNVLPRICERDSTDSNQSETDARQDLGIVMLSSPLTLAELPVLPEVYTGGDFLDRIFNFGDDPLSPKPPDPNPFFQGPVQMVGWGGQGKVPNNMLATLQKKMANVTTTVRFEHTCGFLGLGTCSSLWIEADTDPEAGTEKGDSGGPLTFRQNGTTPTIFGANNGLYSPFIASDFSTWSPTWNNGNPAPDNGDWIQQFMTDADGDGVSDTIDNCPPSRCKMNPKACANASQVDTDRDGVGDVCDNCPGNRNANQNNHDNDLFGDVCDLCPSKPTPAILSTADRDTDKVGDQCDTCPDAQNPPFFCSLDEHCPGSFCVKEDGMLLGHCGDQLDDADGDGFGDMCDSCPKVGNGSAQRNSNDIDENLESAAPLGDVCDGAPVFVSQPVERNSTLAVTSFFSYASIGQDSATAVGESNRSLHPPFSAAPVGFRHCSCHDFAQNKDLDRDACFVTLCPPNRDDFDVLGSKWAKVTLGAAPPDAGFFNISTPALDMKLNPTYTGNLQCDGQPVPPGPGTGRLSDCHIGTPQVLAWSHAVDATAGRVPTFPSKIGGLAVTATDGIFWSHGLVNGTIFADTGGRDALSQGRLRDNYAKVRTPLLSTKLDGVIVTAPPIGDGLVPCRTNPECVTIFRPDWVLRRPTELNPPSIVDQITAIQAVRSPAVLVSNGTRPFPDSVIATRAPSLQAVELSSVMSTSVKRLLVDADRFWLTPVEAGYRGRASVDGPTGSLPLTGVVIPRTWSQRASLPVPVVTTPDGVFLESELAPPSTCDPAFCNDGVGCFEDRCLSLCDSGESPCSGTDIPTETSENCFCVPQDPGAGATLHAAVASTAPDEPLPTFVPSDRTGARGLLSATERNVYFIGGRRGAAPTGEVWRYGVDDRRWTHLFVLPSASSPSSQQVRVGDVQALAYDAIRGKLLVVDTVVPTQPRNLRSGTIGDAAAAASGPAVSMDSSLSPNSSFMNPIRVARLLAFDTRAGTSAVLLSVPVTGLFSKIGMAARDDGSFVVVGAITNRREWQAFQFRLDGLSPVWLGRTSGTGVMLNDPFFSDAGMLLPVQKGTAVDFVSLGPKAFVGLEGCSRL